MASTLKSITSAAYVDCGAGPLTAVRKEGPITGDMLGYVGPTTPADDTVSFTWAPPSQSFDYGGTDKLFLKAKNNTVAVVVVT